MTPMTSRIGCWSSSSWREPSSSRPGSLRAFAEGDWRVVLAGYVIMRLAQVYLWLRVARDDPPSRPAALRFATAITILQVGWVVLVLAAPPWFVFGFMGLFAIELVVPVWAQRAARTPWHPEHITERYGLFTIIVLGESILSASLAVTSLTVAGLTAELVGILFGGLVMVFTMWWLYFERPGGGGGGGGGGGVG